jgi:hypothetical protein
LALNNGKLRALGRLGLLLLIGGTLVLDVFHGIRLGEDQIAYQPIYRLRQSLAVAISRLHQPPTRGYLAYKSVVDVLTENGFALFDDEPGVRLDARGWAALINDGPRLNRIIQQARDVSIDPNLPPQIIEANELGLADYIYLGFRLFGDKISSLYYLFFLITAVSCLIYVLQFRDSPFLLFLLGVFLAELYFLENYAFSQGLTLSTVSNSRLFSALSLLPAMHVLLVLWRLVPLRLFSAAGVVVQSMIFAFLLSCRLEVAWQAGMVVAVACCVAVCLPTTKAHKHAIGRFTVLWPAVIFALVVAGYSADVYRSADARYALEPKNHIFWHEVLLGILLASPQLRSEYAGDVRGPDEIVYAAVLRDINARNDQSSPIVRRLSNGQLTFDLMRGWGEYDKLVKSLTLRILYRHPLAVLETLPLKLGAQVMQYDEWQSMAWRNLRVPVAVAGLAALLCVAAGGLSVDRRMRRRVIGITAIVLLFAAATPIVHPSPLAVGTLFCYLGAIAILAAYGMELLARLLIKARAESVSSDTGSVR